VGVRVAAAAVALPLLFPEELVKLGELDEGE
jgi:hypothetical protein